MLQTACGISEKPGVCASLSVCMFLCLCVWNRYTDECVCFSFMYLSYVVVCCLMLYFVLVGCTVRMGECRWAVYEMSWLRMWYVVLCSILFCLDAQCAWASVEGQFMKVPGCDCIYGSEL